MPKFKVTIPDLCFNTLIGVLQGFYGLAEITIIPLNDCLICHFANSYNTSVIIILTDTNYEPAAPDVETLKGARYVRFYDWPFSIL